MAEACESKLMVAVLERCLKPRGLTYKDLAMEIHLGESSVSG